MEYLIGLFDMDISIDLVLLTLMAMVMRCIYSFQVLVLNWRALLSANAIFAGCRFQYPVLIFLERCLHALMMSSISNMNR